MKRLVFDSSTIPQVECLDLHDAEIGVIECNYHDHVVMVPLKLDSPVLKGVNATLIFNSVKQFHIDIGEPWGPGFYISEVINRSTNDGVKLDILLNSGDRVSICAQRLVYEEVACIKDE